MQRLHIDFSVWVLIHTCDLPVVSFPLHPEAGGAPNYLTLTHVLSSKGLKGNYKVRVISCDTDRRQTAVTPEITGIRKKSDLVCVSV